MPRASDEHWMSLACEEARKALGRTAPNPPVGCVLVKGGRVVGRGYHHAAGMPHAEVEALRSAGRAARGADAYVTLEPCCTTGRTGPCTHALVDAGVRSVTAGSKDPNPTVSGKGLRALARAGVRVRAGVRASECDELIRGFRQWIVHGRPWVELKLAASLDGRIATRTGASKWLSCPESRRRVQEMRARADAVLVGVGTVLRDDPRLTCRTPGSRQPLRVILDRQVRTPVESRVVNGKGSCVVVCSPQAPRARIRRLEAAGAEVIAVTGAGRAFWGRLLAFLGHREILELLVEGGSEIGTSLVKAGVVNGLTIFYTPKLLGGDGIALVGSLGVRDPSQAVRLRTVGAEPSGPDVVWTGVFEQR